MRKESGIILALDMENARWAEKVCSETFDLVDAFKVGYPLVLSAGIKMLGKIKSYEKPVIADFKVADIPYISKRICEKAVKEGADYVIIQGFMGEDVMKACSEVAKIFVVADMTHLGAEEFIKDKAVEIARKAKKHAHGIVAPATRPETIEMLRETVGDLLIISPGVKAQGALPGTAIRAGADFEIVGRGIYQSENPRKAAAKLQDIMREIF